MKATIKLLIIKDTAIDYIFQIEEDLEKQRADYLEGSDGDVDISWEIIEQDLSNLNWIEYGYGANNYGVSPAWLTEDTKNRPDVYSIAYVFADRNWTRLGNQNIWGWSVGFYNNRHVQLIRGSQNNVDSLYKTFLMELMHSFNEYAKDRIGANFNELFKVSNWDEDVVHARHPDWELFKYVPVIRIMKDVLIELFKVKTTETMIGKLVRDPLGGGKVWFVRGKYKHHVRSSAFLDRLWGWDQLTSMSKSRFDALETGEPIGFTGFKSIISIIKSKWKI